MSILCCYLKVNHICRLTKKGVCPVLHPFQKLSSSSTLLQKKVLGDEFPSLPTVKEIEAGWYDWWKENKFFRKNKNASKFIMLLPPPNVTGNLHIGHALTVSIQDAVVRWNQLNGKHVVWIPGCDHAGIATQAVVEKHLLKYKNITRIDLGREEFQNELLSWADNHKTFIYKQIEKLGASLDWHLSYFTLDKVRSDAVTHAFIELFDKGKILRGHYMVNWCCALKSVISDVEVVHKRIEKPTYISIPGYKTKVLFGEIYDVAFKIAGTEEEIVVSTTRPETIPGDTAIMVHPDDTRYSHLKGKMALHPLRKDEIPILFHTFVDQNLGTGAVKITPGHSMVDYDRGKEFDLPILDVIDDNGLMDTPNLPQIHGKPCYEARFVILDELRKLNLLRDTKPHSMSIPMCSRSGDVIQSKLKNQWFLDISTMTDNLKNALNSHQVNFHPTTKGNILSPYFENKRNWCISRQLWWGHNIPVYWVSKKLKSQYGDETEIQEKTGTFVAAVDENNAKLKGANALGVETSEVMSIQSESDVLDTWFSSGLLPLSAFGWPNDQANFQAHYPNSVLETGEDIVYFWVARMIMMGIELTGKSPFKDVLIHGLVVDSKGKKMSKSLQNVIDPLDVIEGNMDNNRKLQTSGFGADALRFYLCSLEASRSILTWDFNQLRNIYVLRNKIWQSARFLIQNMDVIPNGAEHMKLVDHDGDLSIFNRWILSKLAGLVKKINTSFETYDTHGASFLFYQFWYENFCDVYLETVKLPLWNYESNLKNSHEALQVLWTCFNTGMLILHPFMPYLTEELYQRLPSVIPKKDSILQCDFPKTKDWEHWIDCDVEGVVVKAIQISSAIKRLKNQFNMSRKATGCQVVVDDMLHSQISSILPEITRISFLENLELTKDYSPCAGDLTEDLAFGAKVIIPLKGNIDVDMQEKRLLKQLNNLTKTLQKSLFTKSKSTEENDELEKEITVTQSEIKNLQQKLEKIYEIS